MKPAIPYLPAQSKRLLKIRPPANFWAPMRKMIGVIPLRLSELPLWIAAGSDVPTIA
jgi:hypothetical protein